MARHLEVKLIIENHPEQWQALKDAEAKVGCTFFPPDYIPKYAQYGKGFTTAPDVERYFNDKNATLDMFADEIPSCMSVYNLCE